MNAFNSSPVSINTAEATQKLKEILNLGQSQSPLSEKPINYLNGNSEATSSSGKVFSDEPRMADILEKNSQTKQHVILNGNNDYHSYEIYGQNVVVTASPPNQISGNSQVQIKNIVDYGWEQKYYHGRLVAVHISGIYLAYGGIRVKENDKYVGIVRVVNMSTGDRMLIKGMTGFVKDLSFSHVLSHVQLAIIDEIGTLFIHTIQETDMKMSSSLALQIKQMETDVRPSDFHRVIWCHYIPDESVDDNDSSAVVEDASKLLVITHDNKAEMLNVEVVAKTYGQGPLISNNLKTGYQRILEHKQPIIDAAFSPDGTALATASLDGEVKFFQVYMQDESSSPRCLHQWKPHNGKPLSCIFFLDNHKNRNPDIQFWKFAITGADYNREIKIWCCESWKCLQSITFDIPLGETLQPSIKAGLDLSASYLLLSDINRKVLYILILYQDIDQNMASISSLAEFPLPFPMLSFAIKDAKCKKYKQLIDTENIDDINAEENDTIDDDINTDTNCFVEGVVVSLFFIQPKSLQQCRIAFQPRLSVPFPTCSISSISQDSSSAAAFRDHLSDMSFDTSVGNGGEGTLPEELPVNHSILSQGLNSSRQILLTPDAFTSPNHNGTKPALPSTFSNETPTSVPLPPVTPSEEAILSNPCQEDLPLATSERIEPDLRQSGRSSGSSPSLEVQQIFAPKRANSIEIDEKKYQEVNRRNSKDEFETFTKDLTASIAVSSNQDHCSEDVINDLQFTSMPSNVINKEYDLTIWPLAPNLNNELKVISKDTNKESSSSVSFTNDGGDNSLIPSLSSVEIISRMEKLEKRLEELSSLREMMRTTNQAIHSQKTELQEIRSYLKEQQMLIGIIQNMNHCFEKLETTVGTTLEHKMNMMKQADNKQLEEFLINFENRETQRHERMIIALSQSLTNPINNKLDNVIKAEMRNTLLPVIVNMLEPVKEQLQTELTQKSIENILRDAVGKLLKTKLTVETIAGATANALNGYIQSSYKENFQTILIPAFEKGCQNMFQQINENFQRGTKEYNQLLENYLEQKRRQNDHGKDQFIIQLHTLYDSFQSSCEQLVNTLSTNLKDEMEKQYQSSMSSMQEILLQRIQHLVKEEIAGIMKEQHNIIGDSVIHAIRSRAVTPTPVPPDPQMTQARICQFIRQGHINSAFQTALSASDLNIVIYVCEKLPLEQVFGKTSCPLEQPVLLSLIQQLSSDLTSHTELKLRYLQEAVINLDRKNPKEHVKLAIGLLQQKLQQFMTHNPTSEFTREMKILLMASQSVLSHYS